MEVFRTAGERKASRRAVLSWFLFDWAAQPWFTMVTTFVFGPYFAAHLAANPVEGQALWGYSSAVAGFVIAACSPVLGAIADQSGARKPWIFGFSILLAAAGFALWFAAPGAGSAIAIALVAFAVGTIGAEFATVFTNAMMPDLAHEDRLGRLSGTGWAMGYVGGLLSLILMLGLFVADPETGRTILGLSPVFGLEPATHEGDRAAGPFAAIWYLIFVVPLFLFTPDTPKRMSVVAAVRPGIAELTATIRGLRRHANAARFLLANMIYIDGMSALTVFGAIYAASVFGWGAIELGLFGIVLIVFGIIGSVVGGRLDDRIGPKQVVLVSVTVLALALIAILSTDRTHVLFVVPVAPPDEHGGLFASAGERAYLVIGIAIGLVAGPLQSASRTLLVKVAPREKLTQFFGLFALSGRVTAFVGPLAVSTVTVAASSQRLGISVLVLFFAAGAVLLAGVRPHRE